MKQHVNLYQLEFHRTRSVFDAARMARFGIGLAVLVLALTGWVHWLDHQADRELEAVQALRAAESTRVVELASLYPAQEVDPAVEARHTQLVAERDARNRLLRLLGGQSLGNTTGFSDHVAGLARRRVPGLWLREVRIERGGRALALSGSALEPDLVPRFLQELGEEGAFAGRAFGSLRIERPEADSSRIDFVLRTDVEATP